MKTPRLIQRCQVSDGKLAYDYMGSSEFENGGQRDSLRRIFAAGISWGSLIINLQGKPATVYLVAGKGFNFADYYQHLQLLAEGQLRLQESTGFNHVVGASLGLRVDDFACHVETSVWFDIENDVLWTLTKNKRKALVSVLESIQQKWATEK